MAQHRQSRASFYALSHAVNRYVTSRNGFYLDEVFMGEDEDIAML